MGSNLLMSFFSVLKQIKLLFLIALVYGCFGEPQDLSGKVFTIPTNDANPYIKLHANITKPITAMTMCQRFNSGLDRGQTLFSLAAKSTDNELVLYKPSLGTYRVHVRQKSLDFFNLPDVINEWISLCWTWDSETGLTQLWLNGKRSARRVISPHVTITGEPSIMLGQDQDTYGGGFDPKQSFVGDVTDVHFWDKVLSPCDIKYYMNGQVKSPGNLLNWEALQFTTNGKVFIEKSDFIC
ncbi:serum amyloid P-component [Esox lucius]|uniref:Pentraxin family member n=1 Tax=Esox lucius TaxID=8010 RepID=A0AAY5K699_ESOLU|nr:serum amyloid P-component [Esox lucius]